MRFILLSIALLVSFLSHSQDEKPTWELIQLEHEGPEDFVYDSTYNRLIIPSGKREDKNLEEAYGVFQTLDLETHAVKTLTQDEELKDWISLGIKKAPFNTTFQYMTNASKIGEDVTRIQGLSIDENSVKIVSPSIVKGDFPSSVNNLRWVDGKGLYVTNLYKAKSFYAAFLSNLKGEVHLAQNFGKEAQVILNAQGPNSIGMIDSTLYLTGSRERFLMKIRDENEAEKIKTIPLVGGDNVTIRGNKLYTTGSPKVLEVIKYMNRKRKTVGTFIYEVTEENNAAHCSRIILVDPSVGMGMLSVVYKHEGSFYCGQVIGAQILRFKDDTADLTLLSQPKKNTYTRKIYKRYKRLNRKKDVQMPEFLTLRSK
ncbi:MAG: hypothetical protein AB8B56_04925 [Crocinitomicaceae bacterium]